MATLQEVKDKIAQVAINIAEEKVEVQTALAELRTEVQALKDQIATGAAVTPADLNALIASIDAINTSVEEISEPAV